MKKPGLMLLLICLGASFALAASPAVGSWQCQRQVLKCVHRYQEITLERVVQGSRFKVSVAPAFEQAPEEGRT